MKTIIPLFVVMCLLSVSVPQMVGAQQGDKEPVSICTVTTKEGEKFIVTNWQLKEKYSRDSYWGSGPSPRKSSFVRFNIGYVNLEVPWGKITSLQLDVDPVILTLASGLTLNGELLAWYAGQRLPSTSIEGNTEFMGFPSDYSASFSSLKSIELQKNAEGKIKASIIAKDGTLTKNVTNLTYVERCRSPWTATTVREDVPLTIGDLTLNIDLGQIKKISREEGETTIILKDGRQLTGLITKDLYLVGNVKTEWDDMIGTVVIHVGSIKELELVGLQK
ncbi:MAG: hypothetical protein GH144_07075 [Clostridia bacterium]|nr:hypothetical protein [Clostridia bacterium]